MTRVLLYPEFSEVDGGDGGVGRVARLQKKYCPQYGIEFVDKPEDADVLACHISIPDQWVTLYPQKKIVAHCHGLYWDSYDWSGFGWTKTANKEVMELLRISDHITAPSEWVAQTIRRATCRPVEAVPFGVDADEWDTPHSEGVRRYVLFDKTRVDPVCEIDSLRMLAEMLPEVNFLSTAGDIQAGNVLCVGKLPYEDAKKLTLNAWLYLATTRETFGNSTIQAMAAGVPVVGYDWGGQHEIFEHQEYPYLVEPGNVHELAKVIDRIWNDDEERKQIGELGRDIVAEWYDAQQIGARYAQMYHEVAARQHEKRVSVIIPAYNLARYLPDAINSVVECMGDDDECIVIDDCSTDNTGEVIDSFVQKDERIVGIKTPRNLYLSDARNYGIERARGRYVLPLDADDMIAPHTLDILASALDKDRHIHIAYGNAEFFNEADGKRFHSGWPIQFRQEWQVNQRNLLPYCSMYRKEVWQHIAGYRSHNRTAEDADFWTRASLYGFRPRMVTQADTLIYRNRQDSMSHTTPMHDWAAWFSPRLPAGASTDEQLPVPVLVPPVISVIIPVGKGHERYLFDALDSLEAQTFTQWEAVVVNDTGGCIGRLPSWVRLIDGEKRGPAAARNAGVLASHARLILPLDADDYLQPGALEAWYEAYLSMSPEKRRSTILYSDLWNDQGDTPGKYKRVFSLDYDANLLTKGGIHTVTSLYHKDVWKDVEGYDESLSGWEDWAFQIACAAKGYCSRRIAAPLFTYRFHTGSRREENVAQFERSKADIIAKWGEYWEGKQFMACGCQSGQSSTMYIEGEQALYSDPNNHKDATLLVYNGNHGDGFSLTGAATGLTYRVSKGEPFYVANPDLDKMLTFVGFSKAELGPEVLASTEGGSAPVLAAVGR